MLRKILVSLILIWPSAFSLAGGPVDFSQAKWDLVTDEDGIKVYRWNPPDSNLFAFQAEGIIDTTVPKMVAILVDAKRRTEWAPALCESRVVRWISPVERVEYNRICTPFLIKDRDFVIQGKAEFDGKGSVFLRFHSITDPAVPEKDPVRGEALDSSYTLSPTPDRKGTKLQYRMLIDPKGSLPSWIVNLYQRNFPRHMLKALRRQALKDIPDYAMPPGSSWETAKVAPPAITVEQATKPPVK